MMRWRDTNLWRRFPGVEPTSAGSAPPGRASTARLQAPFAVDTVITVNGIF